MERYTNAYYWMNEAIEAFDRMLAKGIAISERLYNAVICEAGRKYDHGFMAEQCRRIVKASDNKLEEEVNYFYSIFENDDPQNFIDYAAIKAAREEAQAKERAMEAEAASRSRDQITPKQEEYIKSLIEKVQSKGVEMPKVNYLEKGVDTTKKEASADIEALKAAARKRARKG